MAETLWSTILARWDAAIAARHSSLKTVQHMTLGGCLAFPEASSPMNAASLAQCSAVASANYTSFFAYESGPAYSFNRDDSLITFNSRVTTEDEHNNQVRATVFPGGVQGAAIIILRHWNASETSYSALAKLLARQGPTVCLLTLPYHGARSLASKVIANDFLSANLGKTIRSVRQSVIDVRSLISVLGEMGFTRFALIGASLGSCIAGIAAAVDQRVEKSALLLTAGDFAEVVWRGSATKHIRNGLSSSITLDELRSIWSCISTETYVSLLARKNHSIIVINAKFDTVVMPDISERFIRRMKDENVNIESLSVVPCGHYTLGKPPFSLIVAYQLLLFARTFCK